MAEWADSYQRLTLEFVGNEVHVLCVYEDDDREWESSVLIPEFEFKKLLGELDKEFGRTKR